ncbi:hypothetical protein AZE42_12450 [Rhizopogon vesiculosus]|uniref:Uncharacterized protein n=1 Tax=Rhizopogon vesiculosus TaxID=180088 RepID=A0A1J8PZS4_9AGAM|nr:hypothetical protein AZE42_12450 [Rhizopogon vesiculosus]
MPGFDIFLCQVLCCGAGLGKQLSLSLYAYQLRVTLLFRSTVAHLSLGIWLY